MPGTQKRVHMAEVFFGIHADGVFGGIVDVQPKAVFKQAQLF